MSAPLPTPPPPLPPLPRARPPRNGWMFWSLGGLVLLWVVAQYGFVRIPALLVAAGIVLLLVLLAAWYFPRRSPTFRRRWPLLLLLVAPWLTAVLCGPLGFMPTSPDPARQAALQLVQNLAFAAGLFMPLLLLAPMRGARGFTLAVGALNLLAGLIIYSLSTLIIAPGS